MIPKLMIMQKAVITVQDKIPLLILLSVGAAFTFVWLILMRKRLNLRWYAAIPLAIFHTIYGVFTVTAFAFLENGFNKETFGNMSLFGGVFFMPLAYWLGAKISKRPMREVFDIFTPCMIFTVMCARVNCVISGCCLGLPIPGLDGTRFPTREAELIFLCRSACDYLPAHSKRQNGRKGLPRLYDELRNIPFYHRVFPPSANGHSFPFVAYVGNLILNNRHKYLCRIEYKGQEV